MIPEAAVEAAAKYIKDATGTTPDRDYLRSVLEAAAKHIQPTRSYQ